MPRPKEDTEEESRGVGRHSEGNVEGESDFGTHEELHSCSSRDEE